MADYLASVWLSSVSRWGWSEVEEDPAGPSNGCEADVTAAAAAAAAVDGCAGDDGDDDDDCAGLPLQHNNNNNKCQLSQMDPRDAVSELKPYQLLHNYATKSK